MTKLAHVERERAIRMLTANVTPLVVAKRFRCHVRTIGRLKNCFQQIGTTHTVRVQGVDVCRLDVKIETSRRLICAIDLIWSQSQLGHHKELIIKKIRAETVRYVSDPHLPTFGGTLLWCSFNVKLGNPRWYQRLNEL